MGNVISHCESPKKHSLFYLPQKLSITARSYFFLNIQTRILTREAHLFPSISLDANASGATIL